MCIIRVTTVVHVQVTDYQCHQTGLFATSFEVLAAGTLLDVDIYDATGSQVCYQYPDGSVAVGVPLEPLTVVSACGGCIDPYTPQHGFGQPLGLAPRWTLDL